MQHYSDNPEKKYLKRNMLASVFMSGSKTQEIYWEMINVGKFPPYLQLKQMYFKKPTSPKYIWVFFYKDSHSTSGQLFQ